MRHLSLIRQTGFSLVSAIFLLVALAALGIAMVTFSTAQHASSAQDLEGARAYQAARAGIEWGVYQVVRGGGTCNGIVPLDGVLSTFQVAVNCVASMGGTEGGRAITIYTVSATARDGVAGSTYYVERQLQVTVEMP